MRSQNRTAASSPPLTIMVPLGQTTRAPTCSLWCGIRRNVTARGGPDSGIDQNRIDLSRTPEAATHRPSPENAVEETSPSSWPSSTRACFPFPLAQSQRKT